MRPGFIASKSVNMRFLLLGFLIVSVHSVIADERFAASLGLMSRTNAHSPIVAPRGPREAAPARLSQTHAFKDTPNLTPADGLIPYDLNIPFWSDGATKSRWASIPNEPSSAKIRFSATDPWAFPAGTVFVKHFELATNDSRPNETRRLETRLLICDNTGGVFGLTYKWPKISPSKQPKVYAHKNGTIRAVKTAGSAIRASLAASWASTRGN